MAITPEWVMATSTFIPILVLAWWLLRWQSRRWQRVIWGAWGHLITDIAEELGAEIVCRNNGFSLRRAGRRVDLVGTIQGVQTRYMGFADAARTTDGMATADSLRAHFRG